MTNTPEAITNFIYDYFLTERIGRKYYYYLGGEGKSGEEILGSLEFAEDELMNQIVEELSKVSSLEMQNLHEDVYMTLSEISDEWKDKLVNEKKILTEFCNDFYNCYNNKSNDPQTIMNYQESYIVKYS